MPSSKLKNEKECLYSSYNDFFDGFQNQVAMFKSKTYDCKNDEDCPSSFQSHTGEMYYWIPLKDIPGCSEYKY